MLAAKISFMISVNMNMNIFFKKMHSPEIDFLFQMNMLLFTMSP